MAMTLAEIRAKLQSQDNRKSGESKSSGDNAIYAHWNIAEGTQQNSVSSPTQTLRILSSGLNVQ